MGDGYVYVVGRGEQGDPVKIGWSGTPEGRVKQLQTGSPHVLRLLDTHPGPEELENFLHEEFAPSRLHGEWFLIEGAVPEISKAVARWDGRTKRGGRHRSGMFSLEYTLAMLEKDSGITGDDFRVFVYCGAKTQGKGSATVNEIAEHLGLTHQGVRRIARKLADVGILLIEDVEGRTIRYRTSPHVVTGLAREGVAYPLPNLPGRSGSGE